MDRPFSIRHAFSIANDENSILPVPNISLLEIQSNFALAFFTFNLYHVELKSFVMTKSHDSFLVWIIFKPNFLPFENVKYPHHLMTIFKNTKNLIMRNVTYHLYFYLLFHSNSRHFLNIFFLFSLVVC